MGTRVIIGIAGLTGIALALAMILPRAQSGVGDEHRIIPYDAWLFPSLLCIADRVIAETDPRLDRHEREALWAEYGLHPTFEWIVKESGFTYHELEVRRYSLLDHARRLITGADLPPRELRPLVDQLNDDPRLNWAAPDALVLEWADASLPVSSGVIATSLGKPVPAGEGYGVSFLNSNHRILDGAVDEWASLEDAPDPFPDFEYYRICEPDGTEVDWATVLSENEQFRARCSVVYGTGQDAALAAYREAGSPVLEPVTVCVGDTGVFTSHPDLVGRLHPNAIDANYRNYRVASPEERPGTDVEITDREARSATGLPRPAIKGQPASHGTAVAGIVARCTEGFETASGPVRLLPASIKSERTYVISGLGIKSPISAAVKLLACLARDFPVGDFAPNPDDAVQNTGDVRVVTISASVPKALFSDAEWRIVASLVGKAAGALAEDLRVNDRVYLFAAGNMGQGEPDRPGNEDFVIAVTASMPYDGSEAWSYPPAGEGANLGLKCVGAPGYGIITSTIYPHPNLRYLPQEELPSELPNFSTPRRTQAWREQTNHFAATSSATPQVAALAALLYAQTPDRDYSTVMRLIEDSTGERRIIAPWGEARGLVDYSAALLW